MRDLLKTVSFGVVHFVVGFSVAYALTGSLVIAGGIALIEPAVNTVAFYFHEKAWKVGFFRRGQSEAPALQRA